jgi:hypothetical protein
MWADLSWWHARKIHFSCYCRVIRKLNFKRELRQWSKLVLVAELGTFTQCCESGSGIWCLWPMDTGSGIGFFRIPDPKPIFGKPNDTFWGWMFYNSLLIGPNFFLHQFKNNIIFNFVIFVATKKVGQQILFSPLSFVAIFESGINFPEPQQFFYCSNFIQ